MCLAVTQHASLFTNKAFCYFDAKLNLPKTEAKGAFFTRKHSRTLVFYDMIFENEIMLLPGTEKKLQQYRTASNSVRLSGTN